MASSTSSVLVPLIQSTMPVQNEPAPTTPGTGAGELYLGHAIEAARESGMSIAVETFLDGCFIDAGTPDGLVAAVQRHGAIGDTSSATRM